MGRKVSATLAQLVLLRTGGRGHQMEGGWSSEGRNLGPQAGEHGGRVG